MFKIICGVRKKCSKCEIEYWEEEQFVHICDKHKCKNCYEHYIEIPHRCMFQPKELDKLIEEDGKPKFILSYDIESIQVKESENKFIHKPNLLIAEIVCDECFDYSTLIKKLNICEKCGLGYLKFFGENCIKEFGDYLYNKLAKEAEKIEGKYMPEVMTLILP